MEMQYGMCCGSCGFNNCCGEFLDVVWITAGDLYFDFNVVSIEMQFDMRYGM